MIYVVFVIALAAMAYAFINQRRVSQLTARLSRTSSHLYELAAQLQALEERLEVQQKDLAFQIKQATGQVAFGPETTIGQIQTQHPFADQILATFHMGGCHSCAVAPEESVAEACARLNVNEAALLAALRHNELEAMPLHRIELQI